jgi:hypothetical protein
MDDKSMSLTTGRQPTQSEAFFLNLGIASAQTAYDLNNGGNLLPGSPLRFIDDSSILGTPGSRPLRGGDLDGFVVKDIFNDSTTGLNSYLAYDKETGVVLIGIAGTNGFGKDFPDTKEDVIRLGTAQAAKLSNSREFQRSLRAIIDEIGGLGSLNRVVISGQSLGGGIASIVGLHLANTILELDPEGINSSFSIPANKIFAVSCQWLRQ